MRARACSRDPIRYDIHSCLLTSGDLASRYGAEARLRPHTPTLPPSCHPSPSPFTWTWLIAADVSLFSYTTHTHAHTCIHAHTLTQDMFVPRYGRARTHVNPPVCRLIYRFVIFLEFENHYYCGVLLLFYLQQLLPYALRRTTCLLPSAPITVCTVYTGNILRNAISPLPRETRRFEEIGG